MDVTAGETAPMEFNPMAQVGDIRLCVRVAWWLKPSIQALVCVAWLAAIVSPSRRDDLIDRIYRSSMWLADRGITVSAG